jgi:hypothetical protein
VLFPLTHVRLFMCLLARMHVGLFSAATVLGFFLWLVVGQLTSCTLEFHLHIPSPV